MSINILDLVEQARATGRGYAVDVVVLRTEKIANSAGGNPRYRFHTDRGIYVTAADVQQSARLTGQEAGAATLRIEATRVITWDFTTRKES